MPPPIDPDILAGFLREASGYLPAVRDGWARYRADPSDLAALTEPHRCVHTIKGAAAMVGLADLSHLAAQVEGRIDELLPGRRPADAAALDEVEFGLMAVEDYLRGVRDESSDVPPPAFDALPLPQFDAFDPRDDLPASADASTAADGELPAPEFDTLPAMPEFAPPAAPQNDIAQELLEVFRLEAEDHLRVLTGVLPLARTGAVAKEQWLEVRRAAHTLKGAAAMVGFADVTTLAHRMEDLLDAYHEGTQAPTPERVDLLLAATDAIEDAVAGRPADFAPLLARFDAADADPGSADVPSATEEQTGRPRSQDVEPTAEPDSRREAGGTYVRVPLDRLNDIAKLVGELIISRTAFEQRMGDLHRLLSELEPSTARLRRASGKIETGFEARALASGRVGGGFSGSGSGADEFDALEFDRYTEFHLLSRDLAETTNDIQTLGGELGHLLGDFDGHLTRQARLGRELGDKLMRLRMVPLSSVAPRLHRTVRTAAKQAGKAAELVIAGGRTELDKAVLEAMGDPLLHLLRNAVDHGLEPAEVRRAVGKPEAGTVTVAAGHEGGQVVLTVSDDGRGIDPERVRAAAVERGVVPAAVAATLTEAALYDLLFAPGFSTRGEVSELSGRGVGLDVVRSKVESLKGTVHVTSAVGRGTSFVVRLPLTLAVARVLLVRASRQTFAIPLDAIDRIVRPDAGEVQEADGRRVFQAGDRAYPLVPLARLLKLRTPADEAVARPPVVLLKAGGHRLGVVVDQLIGGREVVVKDLGSHLKRAPGVSGATLMGDGSVVLILNPAEFVSRHEWGTPPPAPSDALVVTPKGRLTVLVVDDSPSVRRVLTTLVERNGWVAVAARDGLEALEILQQPQTRPDVVLSDIEMPRMDGYELLGTIRGLPAARGLPVVMLSSRSADKHRRRAMELGAAAYLTKPYQDEALTGLIRQLAAARPPEPCR